MFDLHTLKVLRRTKAADDADAVFPDPPSKRVFTFNGDAALRPPPSTPFPGTLVGAYRRRGSLVDPDGHGQALREPRRQGRGGGDRSGRASRVTRRWSIAPCEEPTGLAIDRAHHLLFSGCHNRIMAISDAAAGRKIGEVPIGGGVDAGAFDPTTQLAFASNGDGTLTVVHEDSPTAFHVVSTVPTRRGARTMALDERTHRVYTVTAAFGENGPRRGGAAPRPSLVPGTFALLVLDR